MIQQNTGLRAIEAERQRRNIRQRERRQSMSSSQRAENLARRRANYQLRRQMRNRSVDNTSVENELETMAGNSLTMHIPKDGYLPCFV